MAKVMLVEDDNNLREIYQARLVAEGYQIVAAKDGEEALELAVKEKPDLILLDVMMPKVSGFELLDILRSTEGIKYTKVIMMTALSQAEDKERAEKLGANRYLIKSQVTLEDMAKAVHDVLQEDAAYSPNNTNQPPTDPNSPEQLLNNAANTLNSSKPTAVNPISKTSSPPPDFSKDDDSDSDDDVTIAKKKVISPISDPVKQKDNLTALLAKEDAANGTIISKVVSSSDNLSEKDTSEQGSNVNDDVPAGSPLNNPLPIGPNDSDGSPEQPPANNGVAF